jgi:acetylornithine deacetylase
VLDCIALGKAGHAARNEGVNAILLAMKDIEWFTTYQFPEKSDFLGPVKMSVTVIHAGSQHNVIPDRCEFTVDIRTNEFYTNEALFNHIKQHIDSEVKARSFRLNSSRTEITHPFVQRAILLGKEPFGSPTLSDQALMRFPSVKIGPGKSSRSHTADEFICPSEIREAIDTYIRLLDGLQL